jgi:hypothetical protein
MPVRRRVVWIVAGCAVAAALAAAAGGGLQRAASSAGPFSVTAAQARDVGAVVAFVDGFNARKLRVALAQLARNAQVSDCDYRRVRATRIAGKRALTAWLRRRFADRDQLTIGRIFNENTAQPLGVVAVEFALRRSTTLRALGYTRGITPQIVAKVVLTKSHRIAVFANGPEGGSSDACRPVSAEAAAGLHG